MKPLLKIRTFGDDLVVPVLEPVETPAQTILKEESAKNNKGPTPTYDEFVNNLCGLTNGTVPSVSKKRDAVKITMISHDDRQLKLHCQFAFKEPKTEYRQNQRFSIYFHEDHKKWYYDSHKFGVARAETIWGPYDSLAECYRDVSDLYDFKTNLTKRTV